eukprot:TRINITY_DN32879_c0_g1_i1.p1 TRINITY_DN32879_c0_g1~~TRINITY_DN32879_c0_g1_i1.p1  ORF type:complete len:277 (+),score=45.15 TRINITY_DN32879_c0_g1_i1:54-884(+)
MLLPLRCYLLSVIFFLGSSADLQDSPTELDEGRCGNSFSLLQREVEIQAKIDAGKEGVTHPQISPLNMEVGFIQQGEPDECTAAHLETLLKGLEKQNQKSLETVLTFPLVVLLLLSLIVLLMGHKLVTPVVQVSTSCTLPLYAGVAAAVLAGGLAMCFLELAIVIPGAMFGAGLAYQVQSVLLVVSPSLSHSAWMVDYFWCIALCAALVFAYLAHAFREDIFILITSLLGALGLTISSRALLDEYMSFQMCPTASVACTLLAYVVGSTFQHRSYEK